MHYGMKYITILLSNTTLVSEDTLHPTESELSEPTFSSRTSSCLLRRSATRDRSLLSPPNPELGISSVIH